MKNIILPVIAVFLLVSCLPVNAETWFNTSYKYKTAINASCELCSAQTAGFISVNYTSLVNFGSGKQEIWCYYNLTNVTETVGWLYYNNDSSYTCVSKDETSKTIMNIASGNETNYGSPESNLVFWLHVNKIGENDTSIYESEAQWNETAFFASGKFGNALLSNSTIKSDYVSMINFSNNKVSQLNNLRNLTILINIKKNGEFTCTSHSCYGEIIRKGGSGFRGFSIFNHHHNTYRYVGFDNSFYNRKWMEEWYNFLFSWGSVSKEYPSSDFNSYAVRHDDYESYDYNNQFFTNGINFLDSWLYNFYENTGGKKSLTNITSESEYDLLILTGGNENVLIDEIKIFNRTLTDNEIRFNANQSSFLAENYSYTEPINEFSVKIISPKNQSYNGTRLVNLSIIKSGAINTTWYYNGTANMTFSGLEEYFLGNYVSNQIIVYANDSTGAINKSEKIVYSLDLPNISLITPKNQSYYKRALNITISKTGTFNTTWFFNGTANVTFTGLETYPYYMTDNYSQITIYGNDSHGRIFSSGKTSFNIDLNPPEIIFSTDSSNSSLTAYPKYLLANATFSDYFQIQNMTLFINNSNGIISSYSFTTGNNITMNLTGLSLPYYSYWFEAKDVNNITSKTVPRYIGSIWGYSTHSKRKLITLNESMIFGRNLNFPIFIKITDAQILSYPENQIFFTSANGKDKLKFYFEKFNTSEASAWIKYDIKNETKNYIWVYYSGASGSYEDEAGTFSDYIARFSMSEIPLKDSLGGVSNCSAINSPFVISGLTGNGIYFNYSKEQHFQCTITQKLKELQSYSFEYVFNPNTNFKHALSSFGKINTDPNFKTGMDNGGQLLNYFLYDDGSAGFFGGYLAGSNVFYYGTYNYDGSFLKMSLDTSINGFSTSLKNYKNFKRLNDSDLFFIAIQKYGFFDGGGIWQYGNTRQYNGIIDEMRISNFSRSNEYLKTAYYNLKTNSQFYSLSMENYLPFFTIIKPCSECEYASFSQIIFNITGDYETCYLLLDGISKNINCSSGIYNEILGLGKHSLFMWLNSSSNYTSSDFRYFYVYQEIQGNMTNTDLFGADMPIREKFCLGTRLITVREKTYCSGGTCQTFNTTEAEICHFGCIDNFTSSNAVCNLAPEEKYPLLIIIIVIVLSVFLKFTKPRRKKRR